MSQNGSHTFFICTQDEDQFEWLKGSLDALGQVVRASENLGELLNLAEVMPVSVAFVSVDQQQQAQQCALIEGLLEVHPLLSVIALGGAYDNELAIPAMRAGARDFISYGLRNGEVLGLVRRQLSRLPQLPNRVEHGEVSLICAAQPDADASLVAVHLALALVEQEDSKVLLIDLGIPRGESSAMLGLEVSFSFEDAVRNFRRLDQNVIESAFSHHDRGLHLLPLNEDGFQLQGVSTAEMLLLLGRLRQHFGQIIINLCGQGDSSMLRTLAGNAERVFWHVDQSIACSIRTLELLDSWRKEGVRLKEEGLLVDRYMGKVAPDAASLARTLAVPLVAKLSPSPALRLECRNLGRSLYELDARDALARELKKVAGLLPVADRKKKAPGLLRRLWGNR